MSGLVRFWSCSRSSPRTSPNTCGKPLIPLQPAIVKALNLSELGIERTDGRFEASLTPSVAWRVRLGAGCSQALLCEPREQRCALPHCPRTRCFSSPAEAGRLVSGARCARVPFMCQTIEQSPSAFRLLPKSAATSLSVLHRFAHRACSS